MTDAHPSAAPPRDTAATADDPPGRDGWTRRQVLVAATVGGTISVALPGWLVADHRGGQSGPAPIARGRGSSTSFGSVAVLAARRAARHDSGAHVHVGSAAGGPLPNLTWSTTVAVQVEMFNGTHHAVLLSPGQFRLRLGPGGTTVAPYDASAPAVLAPATSLDTWITYLAPLEAADLGLEYQDTGATDPLRFRLAGLPPAAGLVS